MESQGIVGCRLSNKKFVLVHYQFELIEDRFNSKSKFEIVTKKNLVRLIERGVSVDNLIVKDGDVASTVKGFSNSEPLNVNGGYMGAVGFLYLLGTLDKENQENKYITLYGACNSGFCTEFKHGVYAIPIDTLIEWTNDTSIQALNYDISSDKTIELIK